MNLEKILNPDISLKTERLLILGSNHYFIDNSFLLYNDAKSIEYLNLELPKSYKIYHERMKRFLELNLNKYFTVLSIFFENEFVGEVTIQAIRPNDNSVDIGYILRSDFFKKGIMSEALSRVLKYLFEECDIVRIGALTSAENIPSQKLLAKIGFALEGTRKKFLYYNAEKVYKDQMLFGITDDMFF